MSDRGEFRINFFPVPGGKANNLLDDFARVFEKNKVKFRISKESKLGVRNFDKKIFDHILKVTKPDFRHSFEIKINGAVFDMWLEGKPEWKFQNNIEFSVASFYYYYQPSGELTEKQVLKNWVELSKLIEEILTTGSDVLYAAVGGVSHDFFQYDDKFPAPKKSVEDKFIGEILWLTFPFWMIFVGKDLINEFGENLFLNAPAWRTEKIGSGVFIMNGPAPRTAVGGIPNTSIEVKDYFKKKLMEAKK